MRQYNLRKREGKRIERWESEFERIVNNARNNLSMEEVRTQIAETFENEIKVDEIKVSLLCPLTKERIDVPVRYRDCRHLQCCDLKAFLAMKEKRNYLACPICNAKVDSKLTIMSLCIDKFFQNILSEVSGSTEATILSDGTFNAVVSQTALIVPKTIDDEEPYEPAHLATLICEVKFETDSDDDENSPIEKQPSVERMESEDDGDIQEIPVAGPQPKRRQFVIPVPKVSFAKEEPHNFNESHVEMDLPSQSCDEEVPMDPFQKKKMTYISINIASENAQFQIFGEDISNRRPLSENLSTLPKSKRTLEASTSDACSSSSPKKNKSHDKVCILSDETPAEATVRRMAKKTEFHKRPHHKEWVKRGKGQKVSGADMDRIYISIGAALNIDKKSDPHHVLRGSDGKASFWLRGVIWRQLTAVESTYEAFEEDDEWDGRTDILKEAYAKMLEWLQLPPQEKALSLLNDCFIWRLHQAQQKKLKNDPKATQEQLDACNPAMTEAMINDETFDPNRPPTDVQCKALNCRPMTVDQFTPKASYYGYRSYLKRIGSATITESEFEKTPPVKKLAVKITARENQPSSSASNTNDHVGDNEDGIAIKPSVPGVIKTKIPHPNEGMARNTKNAIGFGKGGATKADEMQKEIVSSVRKIKTLLTKNHNANQKLKRNHHTMQSRTVSRLQVIVNPKKSLNRAQVRNRKESEKSED